VRTDAADGGPVMGGGRLDAVGVAHPTEPIGKREADLELASRLNTDGA